MKMFCHRFWVILFLLFVSPLYADLSTDIVAYYPFSGNANDASGNNHHASLVGNPTLTTDQSGRLNSAYALDGNDYIELENFQPGNTFSISLWVNPSSTATQAFISNHTDGGGNKFILGFYHDQLHVNLDNYTVDFGSTFTGWHHLALVVTETGTSSNIRLYKNGISLGGTTLATVLSSTSGDRAWLLGMEWDTNSPSDHFIGSMDEVLIYDRALNESEIGFLYRNGEDSFSTDLFGYYPFSGDAMDISGNNHHATLVGDPTLTTDQSGNAGSAYALDGNDYIELENFQPGNTFSISLWVNPSSTANGQAIVANHTQAGDNKFILGFYENSLHINLNGKTFYFGNTFTGWHHLVAVVTESTPNSIVKLYKDGTLLWEETIYGTVLDAAADDRAWLLGMDWDADNPSDYFNGSIDEVYLYRRALNQFDINALSRKGADISSAGLIAYYPISGNANDASGNNHHGTLNGSPALIPDQLGNPGSAYRFDGNDYIELDSFQSGNTFSISLWVNPDSMADDQNFIAKNGAAGDNIFLFGFWSGQFAVHLRNQNFPIGDKFTGWHHLVAVVTEDGPSSNVKVYKDGALVGEGSVAVVMGEQADDRPWLLGMEWDGGASSGYFTGSINEVLLYNRVLIESEIELLFRDGRENYGYMISSNGIHSCALDDNGAACWGNNYYGQATLPYSLVNPSEVVAGVGGFHSCALDDNGVTCWGYNLYGQADVPALVNPQQVATGGNHTCALDDNGVTCWGYNSHGQTDVPLLVNPRQVSAGSFNTCALDDTGVVCWGAGTSMTDTYPHRGQSGVPKGADSLVNPLQVTAGFYHTCALDDNGVRCWGDNRYGQSDTPAEPPLVNPRQLTVGEFHTCALDDTGIVCWGAGLTDPGTYPHLNQIDVPDDLVNPSQVAAGSYHTCAVDDTGVRCWGAGTTDTGEDFLDWGQSIVPALINPSQVTAGYRHSCALGDNGVTCWGANPFGNVPADEPLFNPVQIAVGGGHTCVLDDDKVRCWGSNDHGESDVPDGLINPRQVMSGSSYTCALDDNGLTCWGNNNDGQTDVPSLINPRQVSAGSSHICALDDNGVTCWGGNLAGQGDVPALVNPSQVSAGRYHSCALDDNGVTCWGSNFSGAEYTGQINVPALANPYQVVTGAAHTCALEDKGVTCWGSNSYGQTDVPVGLLNPRQLVAGAYHSCALVSNGVRCWGAGTASLGTFPDWGQSKVPDQLSFVAIEDSDADGIPNSDEVDDDNDGIEDLDDLCPQGVTGWGSDGDADHDGDGCRDISEDVDDDNDGIIDLLDRCAQGETGWISDSSTDIDGDGCRDGVEDDDYDNDGIDETDDNCPLGETGWSSDSSTDIDGDGCRDASEDLDDDNDGYEDLGDNCPVDANNQQDTDGDGEGDACDSDDDNDGIPDSDDTYPLISIIGYEDTDGDGIPDECVTCSGMGEDLDDDNDGHEDGDDNCKTIYNPNQLDTDNDSIGDACDSDSIKETLVFSTADDNMWGNENAALTRSFEHFILDETFDPYTIDAMDFTDNPIWDAWDAAIKVCISQNYTIEECKALPDLEYVNPDYTLWQSELEACKLLYSEEVCIDGGYVDNPEKALWDGCMTACRDNPLYDFSDAQCKTGFSISFPDPDYAIWQACYTACTELDYASSSQCKSTGKKTVCVGAVINGTCVGVKKTFTACGPEPGDLTVTVPACGEAPSSQIFFGPILRDAPAQTNYLNIGAEPPKLIDHGAKVEFTNAALYGGFRGYITLGNGEVNSSYEAEAVIAMKQAPIAGQLANISTTKIVDDSPDLTMDTDLSGLEAKISTFTGISARADVILTVAGQEVANENLLNYNATGENELVQDIAELIVGGSGGNVQLKLFGEDILSIRPPSKSFNISAPHPFYPLIQFPMADVTLYLPELATPPHSEVFHFVDSEKVSNSQLPVERTTSCFLDYCPENTRVDFGKFDVDLDFATVFASSVAAAGGSGIAMPLGAEFKSPLGASVELNYLDWDVGAFFSLAQELDLEVDGIDVTFGFSKPVEVEISAGQFECRNSQTISLGEELAFRHPGGPLNISPTYRLNNTFNNKTQLYLQPASTVAFMQAKVSGLLFSAIGAGADIPMEFSLYKRNDPLVDQPIPIHTVFEDTYPLEGFNSVIGQSIVYNAGTGYFDDPCNSDDDGDGIPDTEDAYPLISIGNYLDTDGDGAPDDCDESCQLTGMEADPDDDNDGVPDIHDSFPKDENESRDTDGDGVGDNADPDDDNDGVFDVDDSDLGNPRACEDIDFDSCDDCAIGVDQFGPLPDNNALKDGVDTDSDGACNAGDDDDDNDGVLDVSDNCIRVPNFDQLDENGDGIGDVCEGGVCFPIKIVTDRLAVICL